MRLEQGAFNIKDSDKGRNVRRLCLILDLQRYIQDQERQAQTQTAIEQSESAGSREKEIMTRWLNNSLALFLKDWGQAQTYWQKPEVVRQKGIQRAEDAIIHQENDQSQPTVKTKLPLLENYFNRESTTAWGVWRRLLDQFQIKPASEWNQIESYNAQLENIDPKKLRARFLIERAGFVFSYFPKVAFRQYKAEVLTNLLSKQNASENMPPDLRKSLEQEYKNTIKDIASFRGELVAICAEFGDNPTFRKLMDAFWPYFEQQIQGVKELMIEYTNFQRENIRSLELKKRNNIRVISQSLGNPVRPEFLPKTDLTEVFKNGLRAETTAACLWHQAGWSTSMTPPEWDIVGKLDGVAHWQGDRDQSYLSLYQVKSAGQGQGIGIVDLAHDNWRGGQLITSKQTGQAETILNEAQQLNDPTVSDVFPVWLTVGQRGDFQVDEATGFLLSSPDKSLEVAQALKKLDQLRGGLSNVRSVKEGDQN